MSEQIEGEQEKELPTVSIDKKATRTVIEVSNLRGMAFEGNSILKISCALFSSVVLKKFLVANAV